MVVGLALPGAAVAAKPPWAGLHLDVKSADGHKAHVLRTPGAYAKAHRQEVVDGVFDSTSPLVKGSGPIMISPTNYLIFWKPTGTTFAAGYEAEIQKFFQDVGGTPFLNVITQYAGTNGSPTDTATYGGTWEDTNAYPGSDTGESSNPLTDGDMRTAVDAAIAANPSWQAPGLSTMYFVFTGFFDGAGSGHTDGEVIHSCMGSDCFAGQRTNGDPTVAGYCAYHGVFDSPDKVYASQPYAARGACYASSYNGGPFPNASSEADITLTAVSHEMFEAYTDPELGNWRDATGDEIGDKCAYHFPWSDPNAGPFEPDGTDIVLKGDPFYLQTEWSNAAVVWNTTQAPGQNPDAPGCVKRTGQDSHTSTVPSSIDFGTVTGGNSVIRNVTITNDGLGVMNVLNVRLGGGTSTSFSIPSLQRHASINPGSALTIGVRYTAPASTSSATGSVVVDLDDPQPVQALTIPLSAQSGVPTATLNVASLNFGGVPTDNRTSPNQATRTVILSNTGTADLILNSLFTASAAFTPSSPVALPATISPGSSITLSVDFNPLAPGGVGGSLHILTNDPLAPALLVSLAGTGLLPGLAFAPPALVFPPTVLTTQVPGYQGSVLNLGITNTGQSELIVDTQSSGAPFSAAAAAFPPHRYGPNTGYSLPVTFGPTAVGRFTGSVTIADNGGAEGPVSDSVATCGEGVHRGIRVLAVNAAGTPYPTVSKLKLTSHNTSPGINVNVASLALVAVTTSCVAGQQRQYENQNLPAAPGGSGSHASNYTLSVSVGGKSATLSFTLQPTEFKEIVIVVK
jgi:hypothetical protein